MDAAHPKDETVAGSSSLPRSTVSENMEAALDTPRSGTPADESSSTGGPAVLPQLPSGDSSVTNPSEERSAMNTKDDTTTSTLKVIKGAFAGAQEALTSGYRTVSESTDDFVHESPWKSVAFAVLGGIVIGMLAAR